MLNDGSLTPLLFVYKLTFGLRGIWEILAKPGFSSTVIHYKTEITLNIYCKAKVWIFLRLKNSLNYLNLLQRTITVKNTFCCLFISVILILSIWKRKSTVFIGPVLYRFPIFGRIFTINFTSGFLNYSIYTQFFLMELVILEYQINLCLQVFP